MNIPSTYMEWMDAINYIKNHPRNDIYIDYLNKGTLDYNETLIGRLKQELSNCIFIRIEKEIESLIKYLKGQVDYNSFSLKVVEFRKELIYGKKLASINILPQNIRDELCEEIMLNADKIQLLLTEQTDRIDKTGSIRSIIKNNPINKLD